MGHATEQVEAPALAADRLCHQLGRHVCGVEAMTGISLGIEDVGMILQAADLRQAIGPYPYHAAPLKLDGRPRQLGKDSQQLGQHEGLDVSRVPSRVVAGTTKQQATIGGEAIVVERHVLIAHRHILRQQALAQPLLQHLSGENVRARR